MFEFLNKPINSAKTKLPSKKKMNLYAQENTETNPILLGIIGAVVLVAALVFLKIGVFDRITKLNTLSDNVLNLQAQSDAIDMQLINYDETRDKYRRYTKYYQSGEESGLLSRLDILSLLEDNISDLGNIKTININGNSVSIAVQVEKLEDFALIRRRMENLSSVSQITVNQASKNNGSVEIVEGYISFTFVRGENEQ